MSYESLTDSHHKYETEVYENLSNFMQIFKRLLNLAEVTTISVQKGNDHISCLEKIRLAIEQIKNITSNKQYTQSSLIIQPMYIVDYCRTFHRFACRLIEIISLYKIKYQHNLNIYAIKCFYTCLREIQNAIREQQIEKQLFRIIRCVEISLVKFCANCCRNQKGVYFAEQNRKYQLFSRNNAHKIDKSEHETNYNEKGEFTPNLNLQDQPQNSQQKKNTFQLTKKVNLYPINQLISQLQNKFDSQYAGLEVDFNFYKSLYFQSKNNSQQLYKDCLSRNGLNAGIITTYNDDFYLFQKKKTNRQFRKDKRNKIKRKTQCASINQSLDSSKVKNIQIDKQALKTKKTRLNQTLEEKIMKNCLISTKNEEIVQNKKLSYIQCQINNDFQSSKMALKMKNIYLTLGKKGRNAKNNRIYQAGTSNLMKNKAGLQGLTMNNSDSNDLEYTSKQSMQILHMKLKTHENGNVSLMKRLKTEPESQFTIENQQLVRKLKLQKSVVKISPINIHLHRPKYLEINCMPKTQTSVKSRQVLSGFYANNKFTIKNKGKLSTEKSNIFIQVKQY